VKVLFAPDYRKGDPYQELLAGALSGEGIEVVFPDGYRRGFPLWRECGRVQPDILHIHWPEAYFYHPNKWYEKVRRVRLLADLFCVRQRIPMVITVHNEYPHYCPTTPAIRHLFAAIRRLSNAVVVHGETVRERLKAQEPVLADRVVSMPFPDNTGPYRLNMEKRQARSRLGLDPDRTIHLIFGTMAPYKGVVEMIRGWPSGGNRELWVVGGPIDADYARKISDAAREKSGVHVRSERLPTEALAIWLCAADAVLFRFHETVSSGSLCLALGLGKTVLVPVNAMTAVPEGMDGLVRYYDPSESSAFASAIQSIPDGTDHSAWVQKWRKDHDPVVGARILRDLYHRLAGGMS
jgi:glycosyltransferase involved in cell wall biosynthesis